MRVLVTGATGFIGGHLVEQLRLLGHAVTALARPSSDTTRLRAQGVAVVTGDVTEPATLAAPMSGQDAVIHLAAAVKDPGGWSRQYDIGVRGTQNVIDAAVAAGVGRFVHLSSIAVYRDSPGVPLTEDSALVEDAEGVDPYCRQKLLAERLVWEAHRKNLIRATSFRPPTVLGPGDPTLVPRMRALMSSPLDAIADDARNRFPVTVVEELAAAVAGVVARDVAIGKAYNLAGRLPITKGDLLRYFAIAGLEPAKRRAPVRVAVATAITTLRLLEVPFRLIGMNGTPFFTALAVKRLERHAGRRVHQDCVVDCARATQDLGWKGTADAFEAVRRSMDWQRATDRGAGDVAFAAPQVSL